MLKFLQKINLKNFKKSIFLIFSRFSLSAFISVAAFVVMIILVKFEDSFSQNTENILLKLFTTLVIAFFFSIAIYIFTEKKGFIKLKKCYYQLITIFLGALFYYFFEENFFTGQQIETIVYIFLTIIGVISFLFTARYFKKFIVKVENQDDFYVASYSILLKIVMSMIVGIVTMLLGFLALGALFTLFDSLKDLFDDDKWYFYWSIFSTVFFAPFFLMANLPQEKDYQNKRIENISDDKFFSFLVNYIGVPAIFIYFLILYAYTVKVLINFSEWPQGEVAWLVILFSFFGYLVYFASFVFGKKIKQVEFFRKVLPIAIILQTLMLFYAIGLRINQYDLTMNRYLVVVFGIWLFILSAYYIFSRKKDLSMIFYSLIITVILISIGPWSVYLVPESRQIKRLENNLIKANILQKDKIIPLENYTDIDAKLSGEIYGGIDYLCDFHGCDILDDLFANEIMEIKRKDKEKFEKEKKELLERLEKDNIDEKIIKNAQEDEYDEISNWTLIRELSEFLKVERWNSYNNKRKTEEPEYLNFENNDRYFYNTNIDIRGFDYYIPNILNKKDDFNKYNKRDLEKEDFYFAVINSDENNFELYFGDEILEKIDITESVIEKILNNEEKYIKPKHNEYYLKALLKNEDMTFILIGEKYEVKIVLRELSIKNPNWKNNEGKNNNDVNNIKSISRGFDGYVLLRNLEIIE